MAGGASFHPHPEAKLAYADRKHARYASPAPRQNQLLAALPPEVYERLLPDLQPVALPLGRTIRRSGAKEKYVYFPTSGMIARCYVAANGVPERLAVTGCEGMIGVASFLGGESTLNQLVVLSAGHAYRLRANVLKEQSANDGPLMHLLLRYTLALIAQTSQIAACNRHHPLEQQLCYWLLVCLDHLGGNEVPMTQQLIAKMLGVRRESITEMAGKLQHAGLIHYSRGRIAILDRQRLETHACECYAVVRREYDRLLPRANTAANADVCAARFDDALNISASQIRRLCLTSAAQVPVRIFSSSTTGRRGRIAAGDAQERPAAALV